MAETLSWKDEPLTEAISAAKLARLQAHYPDRRIETLGDAADMTDVELIRVKGLGRKTLRDIKDAIATERSLARDPYIPPRSDKLEDFPKHIQFAAWDITGKLVGITYAYGNDYGPTARLIAQGLQRFERTIGSRSNDERHAEGQSG